MFKPVCCALLLQATLSVGIAVADVESNSELKKQSSALNNSGVAALNKKDYARAIVNLTKARELDPTGSYPIGNLLIAYYHFGQSLKDNPDMALQQFHQLAYLRETNPTVDKFGSEDPQEFSSKRIQEQIDQLYAALGHDPKNFDERVQFANQLEKQGYVVGALVEYQAALRLHDDKALHGKLGALYRRLNNPTRSQAEFAAAGA